MCCVGASAPVLPLSPVAPALVEEDEGDTKLGRASKRSAIKRLVGMVKVGRNQEGGRRREGGRRGLAL